MKSLKIECILLNIYFLVIMYCPYKWWYEGREQGLNLVVSKNEKNMDFFSLKNVILMEADLLYKLQGVC